jgi:uncharacterized membrane protein
VVEGRTIFIDVIGRSGSKVERMPRLREARSRSLLKAMSWRLTGTLDTFIISFIVTGKFTIAGSIAAIELATKITLYYGHERVWARIRWGRH